MLVSLFYEIGKGYSERFKNIVIVVDEVGLMVILDVL